MSTVSAPSYAIGVRLTGVVGHVTGSLPVTNVPQPGDPFTVDFFYPDEAPPLEANPGLTVYRFGPAEGSLHASVGSWSLSDLSSLSVEFSSWDEQYDIWMHDGGANTVSGAGAGPLFGWVTVSLLAPFGTLPSLLLEDLPTDPTLWMGDFVVGLEIPGNSSDSRRVQGTITGLTFIPEPSSALLVGLGAAALAVARRASWIPFAR